MLSVIWNVMWKHQAFRDLFRLWGQGKTSRAIPCDWLSFMGHFIASSCKECITSRRFQHELYHFAVSWTMISVSVTNLNRVFPFCLCGRKEENKINLYKKRWGCNSVFWAVKLKSSLSCAGSSLRSHTLEEERLFCLLNSLFSGD